MHASNYSLGMPAQRVMSRCGACHHSDQHLSGVMLNNVIGKEVPLETQML